MGNHDGVTPLIQALFALPVCCLVALVFPTHSCPRSEDDSL